MNRTRTAYWYCVARRKMLSLSVMAIAACLLTGAVVSQAEAVGIVPQVVQLAVGKSIVLEAPAQVKRMSVGAPETAGVLMITSGQLYVTALKAGATTLTLWDKKDAVSAIYEIHVTPDVARLKQMLHQVLPEEKDLMVLAVDEAITLAGMVSSPGNMEVAIDLAEMYAPEKVTNLLKVGGVHQVMLEVKVAEMRRSVLQNLGIDLHAVWTNGVAFTRLSELFSIAGGSPIADSSANAAFEIPLGDDGLSVSGFLEALKSNGLATVLAEPTLICRSGEQASFLAGGEVPVPVPQGLGTVAIEYKQYGVALDFTPTVFSPRQVSLRVTPEVSELDYANAIQMNGYTIPGITSRRASTTVELGDGQSFIIAGLLRGDVRENIKRFPGLGDIPVLGSLFRSSSWQKNESELVIIVTPRLAKPVDVAKQALPTDGFHEPSAFEFFFMGKLEGRPPRANANAVESVSSLPQAAAAPTDNDAPAGLEGEFGHMLKVKQ